MTLRILTIAVALALAPAAVAQTPVPGNPSVLIVTGEAEIRVPPDEATVRLGIVRQAKTAAAAQDQANIVAKEMLTAITQAGVAPADIRTSGLRLSPMYEERANPPRISGYQASNVVTVRVIDLEKIGPVIDAGLKAGANEIQGVQFGLRNDLAARQQALKQAVAEARKKADTIAEAAGVTILSALEISESGGMSPPRPFPEMAMMRMAADMAATPVSPGDIEVRVSVSIRYQIVKK